MAFTVQDYHDLVQLLTEHPEWQWELRRLLISEDLQALPGIVRDLAEAQQRTEAQVAALAEAQRRAEERLSGVEERLSGVEERLTRLEETVAALAEAQRQAEERLTRLEKAVMALAEAQRQAELRLSLVEERLRRVEDKLGRVDGRTLEQEYREKAPGYFSRLLRKTRVIARDHLADLLETRLPADELDDALLVDLVVRGQPRQRTGLEEVWLAIEVSSVIDQGDVLRAYRRAKLLRKAGYPTIPVVAGAESTPEAETEAHNQNVVMVQDGQSQLWDEALAVWLS